MYTHTEFELGSRLELNARHSTKPEGRWLRLEIFLCCRIDSRVRFRSFGDGFSSQNGKSSVVCGCSPVELIAQSAFRNGLSARLQVCKRVVTLSRWLVWRAREVERTAVIAVGTSSCDLALGETRFDGRSSSTALEVPIAFSGIAGHERSCASLAIGLLSTSAEAARAVLHRWTYPWLCFGPQPYAAGANGGRWRYCGAYPGRLR